jgi:hypothetical protein
MERRPGSPIDKAVPSRFKKWTIKKELWKSGDKPSEVRTSGETDETGGCSETGINDETGTSGEAFETSDSEMSETY